MHAIVDDTPNLAIANGTRTNPICAEVNIASRSPQERCATDILMKMKIDCRIVYFLLGLILGVFSSVMFITPGTRNLDAAQGKKTTDRHTGFSAILGAAPKFEIELSEEASSNPTHHDEAVRDLQLELFGHAVSEPFTQLLQDLSLSQLQTISRSLTEFREELTKHEARTAKIISESDERCVLEIPAMTEHSDARLRLDDQLERSLGKKEAETFLRMAPEAMLSRFADWGESKRKIMVNLAVDPPYIATIGGGELQGYHFKSGSDRFSHIFRIGGLDD